MPDNDNSGQIQDPAEPKRVENAVQTTAQPSSDDAQSKETTVERTETVTEKTGE